jgi:integrase
MPEKRRPRHPGIAVRHRSRCASKVGGRCNCTPSYQAQVWSARERFPIRRSFPTLAAARAWRADAQAALRRGTLRAPTKTTLQEAAEEWLAGARAGSIRTRGGEPYKPSAIRNYEQSLRLRVLPAFGPVSLSKIERPRLQRFVEELLRDGHNASTVRNTITAIRVIYRRALDHGVVGVNPTHGLRLPASRGRRERIASPNEAAALIAAAPAPDRAIWATALYAGLRLGELRALDWSHVDFEGGVIRVERAWEPHEHRFIEPKSKAGVRSVPIAAALRKHLLDHKLLTGRNAGLVFGDGVRPFNPSCVYDRARRAWAKAKLGPITPHEGRHTFASLMIAAGVNVKALSVYMGHGSIAITLDRYGHLLPGSEGDAADLLDALVERSP